MYTVLFAVISTLLILIGLTGLVLPVIPGGVPLAWLGLFIFAIGTGFERISIAATVIFFVVMLLTIAVDYFAPMLGGRKYKAGKWGVLGAMFGSLSGIFVFGIWGILIGPFLGAIFGEMIGGKEPGQAMRIGFGTVIVLVLGMIIKIAVVLVMLGFLIASWF
ncbi:MAG: DUF456 domain-containing protein [Dehalococcoidales bacterium]|nr:DUF456 domain-containing protein [Dehalococcoidales bacterium]